MEEMSLALKLYRDNLKLVERLDTIVRYVQRTNYIDRNTVLLIAGVKEEENE